MARPTFKPTDENRRYVEQLSAFGIPAAQIVGTDDVGAGTRGTAILHAALGQFHRAANPHVHHDPPFIERQVFHAGLLTLTDRAIRAFTGQ